MEQIINFLEQYWGYTIVGGATFGTIITFIVTQIKSLLSSKLKDAKLGEQSRTVDKLMTKCEDLCTELSVKELEKQELHKQLELEQKKALVKEQYFEQVQASTFKAIAFLIAASKLPNEDKIALQKEFNSIVKPTFETYVEEVKETVVPVVEEVKEDTVAVVEETIQKTKSLLDKYTGA